MADVHQTRTHRAEDMIGVGILLAIFAAALVLAKLFADALIGIGAMMMG